MAFRGILALAIAGGAAWLQGDLADRNADRARDDFRYTPDPAVVKLVAGAHRSSVADLIWLRTLPDMSKPFADAAAKARWMQGSFDAITDLEPGFGTVYDFGHSYFLVVARTDPTASDRAIRLLEKGCRQNPESAGLLTRLAMVHWERGEKEKTLEYLRRAAPLPDMDSLSHQMLATLEARGRDDVVALGRWLSCLNDAGNEMKGTEEMKERAWLNLYAIKTEIANRAIRDFKASKGRDPASPDELRDPALIQPEAWDVVLGDLEFAPGPRARYAKSDDWSRASLVRLAGRLARTFHAEHRRWPSLEELSGAAFRLPDPPAGRRWVLSKDRLSLE